MNGSAIPASVVPTKNWIAGLMEINDVLPQVRHRNTTRQHFLPPLRNRAESCPRDGRRLVHRFTGSGGGTGSPADADSTCGRDSKPPRRGTQMEPRAATPKIAQSTA